MYAGQEMLIEGGEPDGNRKRIAVIGCGVGGLTSVKTALDYGHDVTAFERQKDIGGLWNWELVGTDDGYAEIKDPEVHCYPAYKSLRTNTAKYNITCSDFPPSESTSEFMSPQELCGYAKEYAKHFNLYPHIKLNAHVSRLDKKGNEWHISYKVNNEDNVEVFDYVMLSTGAFSFPHYPELEGRDKFKGLFLHSGQVRNDHLFKDKRVLVIGSSYSGTEMMSMAINGGAKKLYVSTTSRPETVSTWTIDRLVKSSYGDRKPWDYLMTRENSSLESDTYWSMFGHWCYPFHKNEPGAEFKYLRDPAGITGMNVVLQGEREGKVEYVDAVAGFTETGANLKHGNQLCDIDIIVSATGYDQKFPFLDHLWPRGEQLDCKLYNYVISSNPNLDGIGFVLMSASGYNLLPVAEIQARWFIHKIVSRSYNTNGAIYSDEERKHMNDTIAEKQRRIPSNHRFNYITEVPILNECLARDFGAQPPDYRTLITSGDPVSEELAVALAYGPYIGTQYRIQGPHAWEGAAQECVKLSRSFLGKHFDEYMQAMKKNVFPPSGTLDPSKGPYNDYST